MARQFFRDTPDLPKTYAEAMVAYAFHRGRADYIIGEANPKAFTDSALQVAYYHGYHHEDKR